MARNLKQGLDYYPTDVNMFEDEKIEILLAEHSWKGFYILSRLYSRIYSQYGYYMMFTLREQKLFANRINVDINDINVCINTCLNENIFDKDMYENYGILTSKGIQTRYFEAIDRRKEKAIFIEYALIDTDKVPNLTKNHINVSINQENVNINQENDNIGTQSKVKESNDRQIDINNNIICNQLEKLKLIQLQTDKYDAVFKSKQIYIENIGVLPDHIYKQIKLYQNVIIEILESKQLDILEKITIALLEKIYGQVIKVEAVENIVQYFKSALINEIIKRGD